jgi:hypothetical protein
MTFTEIKRIHSPIYLVMKRYRPGQVVRYIRTGAVYLLLEEREISMLSPNFYREGGYGFYAYVMYSGRSWSNSGKKMEIFILAKSEYYEILSDVPPAAPRP